MFSSLQSYLPYVASGLWTTVTVSFWAIVLAIALGFLLSALRMSRFWWLRVIAVLYTELFRSIPPLLVLFFVFFALPLVLPIPLNAFVAAAIGLGLYGGAFMGEIVRSGVMAVDGGQYDASHTLGLSRYHTFTRVTLPQAARIAVPPALSECISLLKDSSLASVIGLLEVTGASLGVRATVPGAARELVLWSLALTYFILAYGGSLLVGRLERNLQI